MNRFFDAVARGALLVLATLGLTVVMAMVAAPSYADENIPREAVPVSWKAESGLTSIFFLNRNLGWAVGGQGVVLRTVDGGDTWKEISQTSGLATDEIALDRKFRNILQGRKDRSAGGARGEQGGSQPIRCQFESIHFVNEKHGWIAGGYDVPWVNRSRAVIMRTSDGGITWKPVRGLVIPRIKRIHFSSLGSGWAVGETGNLFKTGIYYSADRGQTWSSHSSSEMKDWIDADRNQLAFVTLDAAGKLGVVDNGRYKPGVIIGRDNSPLAAVRMVDEKTGWAVGATGTILHTSNGGLSWLTAVSLPERKMLRHFDFEAISISAGKVWIAGNPGSFLFSIDLATGKLDSHSTGVGLPIRDIHFVDDQFGWAVGALGTILATHDGGQTWQRQRGEHQSVALLAVATDEKELPLEIIANFSGEENKISAATVLRGRISDATSQAIQRLGCSVIIANGQPAPSREMQLQQLVRTIRTLRPLVIVFSTDLGQPASRSEQIDSENLVIEAIRAAADRLAFPDQILNAGLAPWQVVRLAASDVSGKLSLNPRRMLPRMGSMLEDRIAVSRALLGLSLSEDQTHAYRIEQFTIGQPPRKSDLFGGLSEPGRTVPEFSVDGGFRGSLSAIQLATSKQKKFDEFSRFDLSTPQDYRIWHQQVLSWTLSLDEDVAGIWLMQLAERYLELGKTSLAARTMELLTSRMSDHAFSPAAWTWLIQHYASDEMGQIAYQQFRKWEAVAKSNTDSNPYETRPVEVMIGGKKQLTWRPVSELTKSKGTKDDDVVLAGHDQEIDSIPELSQQVLDAQSRAFFESRWQVASRFLNRLGQRDPDLIAGVQYQILECQLHRKLTGAFSTESLLKKMVQLDDFVNPGISVGAHRELVLGGLLPNAANPVEATLCQQTQQRPRLDGKLDDPVWQLALSEGRVKQLELFAGEANVNGQPDIAMFAWDDKFLYIAVRCNKLQGQYYQDSGDARPRDPDLSRRDRIELSFDVDRDYRSCNHFVIDNRGWVAEQCGGAKGWNPEWFVSQSSDDRSWTIEMAIPLEQLIPGEVSADSTWAFRMVRKTYGSQNLWAGESVGFIPESEGIRSGLLSQPAQYELMQFK